LHCFRWAEVHAFFEAKPSIMTPFSAFVNDCIEKFFCVAQNSGDAAGFKK
jgi:hypothetical protein